MDETSRAFFYESCRQFSLKSEELSDIKVIIPFFCNQVIPFIDEHAVLSPLRKKLAEQCQELSFDIITAEKDALKEVSTAFKKIQRALPSNISDPMVQSIIKKINKVMAGKERYCSPLLHVVLFHEVFQLLHRLLNLGYIDLCKRFAKIEVRQVPIPKDPSAEIHWGIYDLQGNCRLLKDNELFEAKKRADPRLMPLKIEMIWVDRYEIIACTFAPSLQKAYSARQAVSFENVHNPAVVWWYFKNALLLWNLPEDYFNQSIPRLRKKQACRQHFETLGAIRSWRELVSAKYPYVESNLSYIFTLHFLKKGLKTLLAAITTFFSSPESTVTHLEDEKIVFKLELEATGHNELKSRHLWLILKIGETEYKTFYLKRFNDGSPYLNGLCELFQKFSNGGKIQVTLKNNSISKWAERILGLRSLIQVFFCESQKDEVYFKGRIISSSKREIPNFHILLNTLQIHHYKTGNRVFSGSFKD